MSADHPEGNDTLAIAEEVDALCDRYEEAWRCGEKPNLDAWLPAGGPLRKAALVELMRVDLEQRRDAGEAATVEEYLRRYPELREQADGAPTVDPDCTRDADAPAADSAPAQPAASPRDGPENQPNIRTTPFDEVVSLCQAFTKECNSPSQPSICSYLERAREDAQPTLLRNLLAVEVEKRRAAGEQPRVEEYLERFPSFATLVRAVFLELSSLSSVAPGAPKLKTAAARTPAVSRLGDYRLLGELGRGGMGVVYEAVHLQRGHHVALKTLPAVDGAALHRFKREFRALADFNHPNLIGLHTLEADGGQWFFTMELLEGTDFLGHVRPNGALDESELRGALAQLATGVMALHGRHVIHRDLKPSNVMVLHDGRVVLLDFGLVLETEKPGASSASGEVAGTPRYMAPEQAGGGAVTAACDWYAVGVMVYEALAGRPPFDGSLYAVLRDKQQLDPPPLPAGPGVPEDLAALCMRLLARDPKQRPHAREVARVVASQARTATAAPAHGSSLVGRAPHLAALGDACRTLQRQREPLTVFISGRSGEGKTTLAEHFLAPLHAEKRLAVMSGRCYDRESVPFKALDTLIDALCSYLRSLPETDAALLMPDDIGVLAQVFPVLLRVQVVARAVDTRTAGLDDQQVRQRAFRALRALLTRICRRSPIVWFIDDLQWGDADSASALFEVLRPPEAPAVLFLGAYRSDETEGSAFLAAWKELQRKHGVTFADQQVKLAPLTEEECTELVIRLLGKDTDAVRRRAAEFAAETRGNPFLLTELVGCFDPDSDSFEPMPLHEVLDRKLGRLPTEAGQLLAVVAVSGQALSLEEASRTAGHALPPVATLTRMRNERLVRLVGPEDHPLLDTYHDRVRETVLDRMDEGRCKALHLALAEVIEKDVGAAPEELAAALESTEEKDGKKAIPRIYDLAYHFDAAGEKRKAWICGLAAAEQARRQSALEVATQQYAIAARNAEGTTNAVRFRIAKGYGEALMLLGRYEDADERFGGAIDLVEDAERRAEIEVLQGELAFKQGSLDKSVALHEGGLRRLGHWVPRTSFGLAYGILRETVIQFWHGVWPGRLHRKPATRQTELATLLYLRLCRPYAFQNTPRWARAHLAGMNRGELSPPSQVLAYTYAFHACAMSMLGWHTRGTGYGARSIEMADRFDDIWTRGQCRNYQGIGLYASARFAEGITRLTEAVEAFDKAGDLFEVNLAHFHLGCCHFGLGDLAAAVAEARWTFAASARLGDSRTLCSSYLWARATRGNIPFEELKGCYPCRPDDVMSTVHGVMAEGHWHTFHGRTEDALHTFEKAGALVRKTGCVNSHTILALPELAAALRRRADAVATKDLKQCKQLRKRAYRLAKWAVRITRLFPAAYPLSLRERALILDAYGKTKKALKFADKSCAVAESQKAKYQHAQSLLVRGKLAKKLGRPEADEQIRTAEAALEAIEAPVQAAMKAGD